MRKIERQMNAAITAGEDFRSANTRVYWDGQVAKVYLYGNKIAEIGDNWIQLFDGGCKSATTKSRLNAILAEHGCPGECVFQEDFKWFVQQKGGPVPFFSGMRLN
jgi:hypothetical protein